MSILMVLLMLTASGLVQYLADGNLASGPHNNVVRNWEQYGLLILKDKLVMNPGGFEALTRREIYKGHRAASLYSVFFIKPLFAWTGVGTLAFPVVLSPKLASIAIGIAQYGDGRVVVLNDLSVGEHIGGRAFLLPTSGEVKLHSVAMASEPALASWPLVRELLALYSTKVSRRLPGNRGLRPGTCYLYELNNEQRCSEHRGDPQAGPRDQGESFRRPEAFAMLWPVSQLPGRGARSSGGWRLFRARQSVNPEQPYQNRQE